MFWKLLFLALFGAVGTLTRYGLTGVVQRIFTSDFPYGTAAVNIFGCLFFGLLWAAFEPRLSFGPGVRTVVFVGFFGAFTTFSTFAFETARLLDQSQWFWAAGNFLLQNGLGILALVLGLKIGSYI